MSTEERPSRKTRLEQAAADRDAGMALTEQAADPRVILQIDAAIEKAISSGRRFSANDIRDALPVANEHLVGARMRSYAGRRAEGHPLMVRVGYTPSTLRSTHHHEIKVWLGWDAAQTLNRASRAS